MEVLVSSLFTTLNEEQGPDTRILGRLTNGTPVQLVGDLRLCSWGRPN